MCADTFVTTVNDFQRVKNLILYKYAVLKT